MTLEGTLGYETVSISLCVNIEPSRNCKYLIKGVKKAKKRCRKSGEKRTIKEWLMTIIYEQ